jgi:hypothetical protein
VFWAVRSDQSDGERRVIESDAWSTVDVLQR